MTNDWPVVIDREAARRVADDLAQQQGVRVATIPRTGRWGGYYVVPIDYVAEPDFTEKLRKSISRAKEAARRGEIESVGCDASQWERFAIRVAAGMSAEDAAAAHRKEMKEDDR